MGEISEASESKRNLNRYVRSTFKSLVHAIIPPHLKHKNYIGTVQVAGAQDLHVYEYVIWILDHSIALSVKEQLHLVNSSISKSTAELLDIGAVQLIQKGQIYYPLNVTAYPGGGPFSSLSPIDRLRAITLIEQLDINLESLSTPYKNNPGLVRNMMDVLNELSMFGHYSEWAAYGTTRLFSPEYRRVEFFPPGWEQTQYPGPSFGYRDFRGFLAIIQHKKVKD
ncbi:hypothetical protein [Neobacillus sp. DY30]|uniref:hypothetical protein n=1 Tax=Neobacillus sp. DY30 TaxID=3047871 RepID=UPI0024C0C991|nr:hypothetical protein [Neobacillus sp. DY30]WHY01421.1 hypothetical protein QNH29_03995 [Neobacillus sp. DY30]